MGEDYIFSEKTDPKTLVKLLITNVEIRGEEMDVKVYSLRKRKDCVYQEVSEPQDDDYLCKLTLTKKHVMS